MVSLRFDFRDIFRANRLAFSLQRIWIQFVGLVIGYLGYLIFTYLSLILAGKSFSNIFSQMGLLPCLAAYDANWYSWIVFIIGVLFLMAVYLLTSTAVSRATYMLLKGNNFYTWNEAFAFALKKAGSVLFSPLALAILIILFIIGGLVIGLLGKIPYVGELGFSVFYLLWLLAGLSLVFFIIILTVTVLFSPAIIATTDDDAFEAVFQSFSTFWNQPWRMIIYEALAGALAIVGFLVFAVLVKQAFLITDSIFMNAMGDKYINLMGQAMYLLSGWVAPTIGCMNSLFGNSAGLFYFKNEFLQLDIPTILNISAYIFSIMLLIFGAIVVSYGLSTFNVGQTLVYLILRKKKDNENLLERKDKEEEMEEEEEKKEEEKKAEVKEDKEEDKTDESEDKID